MRILMVNKFLFPNGGSETYVFEIGKQLQKMGHEVQYFGMEHESRIVGNHVGSYTANMDFHTGKLEKLLYPFRIIYSVEARKKIRYVLEDFLPDVVHLNNFNFQLTPSIIYEIRSFEKKCGKKVRIVFTAHDYQLVCPNHLLMQPDGSLCMECLGGHPGRCALHRCIHESKVKSLLGSLEGWLYQHLHTYRKIDVVICPSHFMEEKLSNNSDLRGKTVVMHNFVKKNELTTQEKRDYVLYFGRYCEEKGTHGLLAVCRRLQEIPFVFAGSGPMEMEVNCIPNVDNRGFLSGQKLRDVISQARFSVFPSEWYENCPFAVMETQIYGTPVIASDLGGTPELVRDHETGELFHGRDWEELENKIRKLWQDRKRQESYAAACKEVKFHTPEKYCMELIELYQK